MVRLRLFGTVHIEEEEGAKKDLDQFADGVDALFIEEPESYEGSLLRLLFRNPGFFLGGVIHALFMAPFKLVKNNSINRVERSIAESYSSETGVSIYPVDIDQLRAFSDVKWRITLISWPLTVLAAFSSLFAVGFIFYQNFLLVIIFGGLAVIFTMVPFGLTVNSFGETRNRHMLDTTLHISEREGYDDVCLIVGDDHREKISQLAKERGIEITEERSKTKSDAILGKS